MQTPRYSNALKSALKEDMLNYLFDLPTAHVNKLASSLVTRLATQSIDSTSTSTHYAVVYRGINYGTHVLTFHPDNEEYYSLAPDVITIDMTPEMEPEFEEAYQMWQTIEHEEKEVNAFLEHIFNNSWAAMGTYLLLNKNLHHLLPTNYIAPATIPHDAHRRCREEFYSSIPAVFKDTDKLINKRILTNTIIKNL